MSEPTVIDVGGLVKGSERLFTREFVILLAAQACFGMSFSAMFLLPKYLKLELAASDAQIGALQAIGAFAGVLAFPVTGALNDRFGRKPFLAVASVLMTFTAFATLSLREVGLSFYLLRVVQGISFAMFFNTTATLSADQASTRTMGRALAVFGASMLATNALAPAITEPIAQAHGFKWMFYMAVGWGALSLLLGFAVTERKAQRSTDPSQRPGLRELLRSSEARQAGLVMAAAGAGFGTVFTFHQPYALSLGITRVSGFFIGYALFALVVRLGLMGYVERFGRMRVSALCMLLYAAGVIATAGLRPGMLEVVGAMLGTAQGIFYPVFNAVAVESVPAYQRGSMMALYHGGFNAGTALAMLLGGAFAERHGYPALFVGMGSITACAAFWLMRGKLYVQPAT